MNNVKSVKIYCVYEYEEPVEYSPIVTHGELIEVANIPLNAPPDYLKILKKYGEVISDEIARRIFEGKPQ